MSLEEFNKEKSHGVPREAVEKFIQESGFTLESTFIRYTTPSVVISRKGNRVSILQPDSNVRVRDVYHGGNIEYLTDQSGIRVLEESPSTDYYRRYGSLKLRFTLGDILEKGGRLYPESGSEVLSWCLSLPHGTYFPAEIIEGELSEIDAAAEMNKLKEKYSCDMQCVAFKTESESRYFVQFFDIQKADSQDIKYTDFGKIFWEITDPNTIRITDDNLPDGHKLNMSDYYKMAALNIIIYHNPAATVTDPLGNSYSLANFTAEDS